MAIELLNIQAPTSLMVAETASWTCFQGLILGSRSTLRVQMLSQVVVRRFQLLYDVRATCASSLECHVAVSLVHMVNIIMILHSLSVVLILENLRENSFSACRHARVIN